MKSNTKYILVGYGMGLTILMVLITTVLIKNNTELRKKMFIVDSSDYLWCGNYNTVNKFIIKYENRYTVLPVKLGC